MCYSQKCVTPNKTCRLTGCRRVIVRNVIHQTNKTCRLTGCRSIVVRNVLHQTNAEVLQLDALSQIWSVQPSSGTGVPCWPPNLEFIAASLQWFPAEGLGLTGSAQSCLLHRAFLSLDRCCLQVIICVCFSLQHISISPTERSYTVNLEPFMNTSPYTVHEVRGSCHEVRDGCHEVRGVGMR